MKKLFGKKILVYVLVAMMMFMAMPQEVLASSLSGNEILQQEQSKLNYVYVENKYVQTPGEQNVLISMGDANFVAAAGTLQMQNYRTKELLHVESEVCFENAVVFPYTFESSQAGIYEIVSVTITDADGNESYVNLKETGMAAVYFGVDEEVVEVEATLSTESVETVDMQIVSLDAETGLNGSKAIAQALSDAADDPAMARTMQTEAEGDLIVVLDPGHDATHCGAIANGLREEKVTIKIAQYCKEELEQYRGVQVYMTRNSTACPHPGTTSTVDNRMRVEYAKSVGADVYVSLHLNAAGKSAPNGAEVFYPNANYNSAVGSEGANLAKQVSRQLAALGLNNRGISIRNSGDNTRYPDGSLADYYGVIKNSKLAGFPAIIVEHAFMTNGSDAAFLSNEENLKKLGIADATGIANYYGLSKRKPVDRAQVTAYVTRLYELCLNRTPDNAGLNDWVDKLCNYESTGATVAQGFFFSPEFINKKLSDEQYVELLYNVMMNRSSDVAGKADWLYKLQNGVTREGVFKGFADSAEFHNICESYGIERGTITVSQGRDRNPGLTTFVARLYTKALGRQYDVDGLNTWCNRICDGEWSALDVATTGFFSSEEFLNKRLTNGRYVEVLYETFFDRASDRDGYVYWLRKLNAGEKRADILAGFANSEEFRKLMASYGL